MEYTKTYITKSRNGILVEVTEHHDEYGIGYTCRTLNGVENKRHLTGVQTTLNLLRRREILGR